MPRQPRKPITPGELRPVTEADLIAAWSAHKARKASRNVMVSDPSAPYVFAPRHMWRKGTKPRGVS